MHDLGVYTNRSSIKLVKEIRTSNHKIICGCLTTRTRKGLYLNFDELSHNSGKDANAWPKSALKKSPYAIPEPRSAVENEIVYTQFWASVIHGIMTALE